MSITHEKVSTKEDGDDDSLVLPSNWNADHTLTATSWSPTFKAGTTTCTIDSIFAYCWIVGDIAWWLIRVVFSAGASGVMSITDIPTELQTVLTGSQILVGSGLWANEGSGYNQVNVFANSGDLTTWKFKKYNDFNDYSDTIGNTDFFSIQGFIKVA